MISIVKFFKKIGYPKLFGNSKIVFLHNANILKYKSQNLIKDVILEENHIITVIDPEFKLKF